MQVDRQVREGAQASAKKLAKKEIFKRVVGRVMEDQWVAMMRREKVHA